MYVAPPIEDIIRDLRASVKSEITTGGVDPWIWPNNLVPVLKAFAAAMRSGYLRLEYIHQQAFVVSAQGYYLDFHGIEAGGLSREPAQFAQGQVESQTAVLGSVIEDGMQLARSDGLLFVVVGTTTCTAIPMLVQVRAVQSGELSNTDAGATLAPLNAIVGITDFVVSAGGLIGGTAPESDDSFRQRILYHKQNPPHGGSPAEYVEWCQTKNGVTRVFIKRATPQPGSVTVYFMMDGIGSGFPSGADVSEMQSILDQLAPADADVIVAAPTPLVVDVTVSNLVPDTAAVRDGVVEELKAMFLRNAEPASVIEPFTFAHAWLHEAVSMVPKWRRSKITVPADDIVVTTAGQIPILGLVIFT